MSDQPPPADRDIDALVRAYLHQTAARTDVGALFDRIRIDAVPPVRKAPPRPWRRRLLLGLAAAAVLLGVLLPGLWPGGGQASAESLVREAQKVLALPIDHCYLVETRFETDGPRPPLLAESRVNRLWTRGDRFWIESTNGNRRWACGRDEAGALWVTGVRHTGLRFDAGEVPEGLALACDVCSMQTSTLLEEVLRDFDLHREEGAAAVRTIRAEPKAGREPPHLRSVVLDLDAETNALRRVVLRRTFLGRRATTTFTLVDTQTQDPAVYELEGHLDRPFRILSRSFESQRRLHLSRLFGPAPADPRKED